MEISGPFIEYAHILRIKIKVISSNNKLLLNFVFYVIIDWRKQKMRIIFNERDIFYQKKMFLTHNLKVTCKYCHLIAKHLTIEILAFRIFKKTSFGNFAC